VRRDDTGLEALDSYLDEEPMQELREAIYGPAASQPGQCWCPWQCHELMIAYLLARHATGMRYVDG
jgi:hypothetical protein